MTWPKEGASAGAAKNDPTEKAQALNQNSEGNLEENQEHIGTEATELDKERETLEKDQTVSAIQEWLLQEKLLIQELKKFKPVRQPNNPNPPWEYYVLRQKQLIVQLKQIRRRIDLIGKKDEYFLELRKLSQIANRLLELANAGEYTEYQAAAKSYDLLLNEIENIALTPAKDEKKIMPYRSSRDEESPVSYGAVISHYFELLSEG
ncbi:MAG TPA: hypothetical protein VJC08_02905 [bacterium]|nr:hypothetical protein [bacterium]